MSETTTDYEPISVKVSNLHEVAGQPGKQSYRGVYTTFQLTANDPVQCILPEDEDRCEAYVWTLDNDIVIGTKNQVSAAQNTASGVPYPIGAYLPAKTNGGAIEPFTIRDCNAVYAGVTTTASNSRVSVAAYYRD